MSAETHLTKIAVFKGKQIRRHWDEATEKWYFSVVDVLEVLTESKNPAVYWRVLKKRLQDEGANETVTKLWLGLLTSMLTNIKNTSI